jgi:hypothetical protein
VHADSDKILFTVLFVYFTSYLLYTLIKPRKYDSGRGNYEGRRFRRLWHDVKRRFAAMRASYAHARERGAGRHDALESAVDDVGARQNEFDRIGAEEERLEEAHFPRRRAPPPREKPARTRFGLIARYAEQDAYTSMGWTGTGWGLIFLAFTTPFWIHHFLHLEEGPPGGVYLMTVLIIIWTTFFYLFFRKHWREKVGSRIHTLRNGQYCTGRIQDLEYNGNLTTIVYEVTGPNGEVLTGRSQPLLYPYCCDREKGQRIDVYLDPSNPMLTEADVFDYRAR